MDGRQTNIRLVEGVDRIKVIVSIEPGNISEEESIYIAIAALMQSQNMTTFQIGRPDDDGESWKQSTKE